MFKHKAILFLLLVPYIVKLSAQSEQKLERAAITKAIYQHTDDDSPGVAVGIVRDGRIVHEQYVGYANLEHQIKVAEDTRFNIASNAKQFTALCILRLAEQGKLKLDNDFRTYLPEYYENIQEPITVNQLLNHTSGIRDIYQLWALQGKTWWQEFIGNEAALELLRAQNSLNFTPGSAYLYSNSNYILLTEIVKRVSGQEFSAYAKALFAELDMPHSGFLTNYMAVVPGKARPYGNWNGWLEYPTITQIHGDGALFTTLRDQLKWEQILQVNDGKHLSETLLKQSQRPVPNAPLNNYGYGLFFDQKPGLAYAYHNGNTGAYNATFLRFPSSKSAIVVMSNNANVPTNYLAWQVANTLLGLEASETVYPAMPEKVEEVPSIQAIIGVYRGEGDNGTIVRIVERDGSLYREIYQRDPVKLINERGGLYAYETIEDLKMNFTNIGQADQRFTLYLATQLPATYRKVADEGLDNFPKQALNGRYYNEETETAITVEHTKDNTYSLTGNGQQLSAEMLMTDYLSVDGGYQVEVERDENNQVVGLSVSNDRIRRVLFKRKL